MIDPKLQLLIDREIQEGEKVLWSGMPKPIFFNQFSSEVFRFGVHWTLFAAVWLVITVGFMNAPASFGLMGTVFLLIGFGILSCPLWIRRRLSRTAYVITDRRAIIVEHKRGGAKVKSVPRKRLGSSFRCEYPDGRADVIIDREVDRTSDGTFMRDIGFESVADGRAVEKLLAKVARCAGVYTETEKSMRSVNANARLDSYIPPDLQRVIFAEIDPGEKIRWSAMPQPIYFTLSVKLWYGIGIPILLCCMIGAAWFAHTLGKFRDEVTDTEFIVIELIFIALLIVILSKPIGAYRESRRIAYVITDRRAIAFEVKGNITIRSFTRHKLANRVRRDHRDGTADVVIDVSAWRHPEAERFAPELGFFRIQDVDRVEELLEAIVQVRAKPVNEDMVGEDELTVG